MAGLGLSSGGGGGVLRAQTVNVSVPTATTGLLTTVSTFGLLAPVTFAGKTTGNLTLASGGGISAAAGISAGVTQSITSTMTSADGVVLPFTANLTGATAALSISGSPGSPSVGDSTTFSPTITGGTAPYTLTLLSGSLPAGRSISGLTVVGTYTTAASYTFTLRVTDNVGATADLPLTVTVNASVSLPQTGALVARFSSTDIPAQSDNTDLASWTDAIGGAVANAVTAPKYRTNRLNSLPSVQFTNSLGQHLAIDTNNTAITSALNGLKYTILLVLKGANGAQALNFPFGAMSTGQSGCAIQANATDIGPYKPSGSRVPYTSDLLGFETVCVTNTNTTLGAGSGVQRTYINGGCAGPTQNTGQAAVVTPAIGMPGIGWTQHYFTGEIFDILIWNVELTNAEVKQAQKWVCNKYAQALPWAGMTSYPIFAGDSITMGLDASALSKAYPYVASMTAVGSGGLGLKYGQWDNIGRGGCDVSDMVAYAPGDVDNVSAQTGIPTTLAVWEFYNMRNQSNPASQMASYLQGRITAGISSSRIVFGTTIDYTAFGAEKSTYTTYWDNAANRTGLVGQYVSLHTNANIGVDGANTSATYFYTDHVHLIDAGYNEMAFGTGMFASKVAAAL